MSAVTTESTEQKDYTSWFPLRINYQIFYHTKISDEIIKLAWERFLTPSKLVYCVVTEYDGKIVELVHYLFHRSTWAESNYYYLEDLFISEETRGQHIGKQPIEYVQQQARKHHAPRLYWHTHETDLREQRSYDRAAQKSRMIKYRV